MPERNPDSIAAQAFAAGVDAFADEVSGLRLAVDRNTEAAKRAVATARRTRAWQVATVLLVIYLAVASVFAGFAIRNISRTQRLVRDTVTPNGPIARRNAANSVVTIRHILVCDHAYADHAAKGTALPPDCP